MKKPTHELNQDLIASTLGQLQGVVHVTANPVGLGASTHAVIVWTHDFCVDASISKLSELDCLVEVIEDNVTQALTSKKYRLNFRITY